jgi:hypothetical protein
MNDEAGLARIGVKRRGKESVMTEKYELISFKL